MKKIIMLLCAFAAFSIVGVLVSRHAYAATPWQINYWNNFCSQGHLGSGCHGYFTGNTPWCIPNVCSGPNEVLSNGINVGDINSFVSIIQNGLYFGSREDECGAAFIINVMLGRGAGWGSCSLGGGSGVAGARASFAAWDALVRSYAASSNPAYGINWTVWDDPSVNSSWFPDTNDNGSQGDDIFHSNIYHCLASNGICGGKYEDDASTGWVWRQVDLPVFVIQFYFPGGSFEIERGCGNLVGALNPLPAIDQPPFGTISVSCNLATSQEVATVTLGDPDAATNGYITTPSNLPSAPGVIPGSFTSGLVVSPGPQTITIPLSNTNPYVSQTVYLHVQDTGPGGTGLYSIVAQAQTPPIPPNQPPCVSLSCGTFSSTPSRLDPYMGFSGTVSVGNSVGQAPPGATINMTISPPVGAAYTFSGTQAATGVGGVSSATFSGLGPTGAAGVYTVNWTLNAPPLTKSCSGTFSVFYMPYLSIYGGDAYAGVSPLYGSGASTCATNANAGIFSWNNDTTNYSGAGAQFAVLALAQIEDFASAQNPTNSPPMPPTGLSLANMYTPAEGLFGGYFGAGSSDCDFTSDITSAPATTNTTIGGTTVATGTRTIQFVKDADVYISGNIVYASTGGWAKLSDIPYYRLVVVGGNIYIDPGVTQLDGLYVAEPDATGGGVIYTCATAFATPVNPAVAGYYAACHNQLVVNGAFVAKQTQLLRTAGSQGQATAGDTITSNHGAEVFNYTPELWLPRNTLPPNQGYAAITGLPPVL